MKLFPRLATATIALSSGCAAITASRTEIVRVDSRPEGAEVHADGQSMGQTPVDLEVSRKRLPRVRIRVEKEGYHSEDCRLDASPGVGYVIADALLCLVFFPVGCVALIDADGSWNTLNEDCHVDLRPRTSNEVPQKTLSAPPPPPTGQ